MQWLGRETFPVWLCYYCVLSSGFGPPSPAFCSGATPGGVQGTSCHAGDPVDPVLLGKWEHAPCRCYRSDWPRSLSNVELGGESGALPCLKEGHLHLPDGETEAMCSLSLPALLTSWVTRELRGSSALEPRKP